MKFVIERASSGYYDETPPCKNSIKETLTAYDMYGFKSFEDYENHTGYNFLNEGFDHKVSANGICRSIKKDYWTIELASLEDLLSLVNSEGRVVIASNSGYLPTDYPELLIYDDYIE